MDLLPAIDLIGGQVVRLRQGDYGKKKVYDAIDPIAQAQAFEDAGARWLHVVDLDGAKSGEPVHMDLIGRIARRTNLKIEVGGGIRHRNAICAYMQQGIERIILGTAALQRWEWFQHLVEQEDFHHKLVLGLDARGGQLAVSGWEHQLETTALAVAQEVSDWPLAAINYTDIAQDGTFGGVNIESTVEIAEATKVPVVASGGVGSLEDLQALRGKPIAGVIVGKSLYEGKLTIEEALEEVEGPRA